nr:unnamed protein product [Digitaria exilis]
MAGMAVSASTGVMNSLLSKLSTLLSDKYNLLKGVRRDIEFLNASEIQKLKARVAEQSQSRNRYKIEESTSKITAVEVDPRLPALFEESKRLVGIDVPREKITKLLMEEDDSDSGQRKVVSIVGFGGLGKTTVAKQVYEEIKVKYLIVIDDLWSIEAWNTIECALVKNTNGSRVITTTRLVLRNGLSKLCSLRALGIFDIQDNSIECVRDLDAGAGDHRPHGEWTEIATKEKFVDRQHIDPRHIC